VVRLCSPPTSALCPYPTLFRSELLDGDAPVGDLEILATDEFNYCRDGAGAEVAAVVDDLPLDTGLAMDALLERGEARFAGDAPRSEEHTSELQSRENLVCRLLL